MDYKIIFTKMDLTTIKDFFDYMQKNFEYGWIDNNG